MALSEKKCTPCHSDQEPMKEPQISDYLAELGGDWRINESGKLSNSFTFKNFVKAMDFANTITEIAEEEGHHPDLHIYYGKCVVDIWTHKIHGLSENDFYLAAKITEVYNTM